jgi:hypothetical protein
MIYIDITESTNTKIDMADTLRRIAKMIEDGNTSGYYPTWELTGEEEPENEEG